MNTDLANSEFKQKTAEAEVAKLREFLKQSEERYKTTSDKLSIASRGRDDNAIKLATEEVQAHQYEAAAERATHAELSQHSHFKRLQDEYTMTMADSSVTRNAAHLKSDSSTAAIQIKDLEIKQLTTEKGQIATQVNIIIRERAALQARCDNLTEGHESF